jgi:hypothetical protein
MLKQIDHAGIAVEDLEAAVEHLPADLRRRTRPPRAGRVQGVEELVQEP